MQSVAAAPRPANFPGPQLYNVSIPQTGCTPVGGGGPGTAPGGSGLSATTTAAAADLSPLAATATATAGRVPWLQRCWAVRREYVDIATPGVRVCWGGCA